MRARSVSGAPMDLNVLYFAHVRAVVGRDREAITIADGAAVADAVAALTAKYPVLVPLMGAIRVAVNGEFVSAAEALADGDELVLIPPVAGGAGEADVSKTDGSKIHIGPEVIGDGTRTRLEALVMTDRDGASVSFVGVVRNHARGRAVTRLFYEAYGSMALKQMERLVAEVESEFAETRVAIHHRVGMLEVGDVAVVIAAASPHRAEAFKASQQLIDRLKQDVPIWKREIGPDGEEWVSDRP